jgi:hypothetical protein
MPLRNTLCALSALLLGACSQEELVNKLASEEDKKIVAECLEQLRRGDIATLEARVDPSLRAANLHDTLVAISEALPDDPPDTVKLVGVQTNSNREGHTANLTYQYGYGSRSLMVNCAYKKSDGAVTLMGISVEPLEKSLEEQHKFDLSDKPASSYAILIAACLAVIASVVALIFCVMEKGLRRKWAWVLFIIFGFFDWTLNWDTGEITFSLMTVQLFSAGAVAQGYGPWIISVALPVGAVTYLVRRFLNHRPDERSNSA